MPLIPHSTEVLASVLDRSNNPPQKGLCIYFPGIKDDFIHIPACNQDEIIAKLGKEYGEYVSYALRAALEDYIFPYQKVIVTVDKKALSVAVVDLTHNGDGSFFFDYDDFSREWHKIGGYKLGAQIISVSAADYKKVLSKKRKEFKNKSLTDLLKVMESIPLQDIRKSYKGFQ